MQPDTLIMLITKEVAWKNAQSRSTDLNLVVELWGGVGELRSLLLKYSDFHRATIYRIFPGEEGVITQGSGYGRGVIESLSQKAIAEALTLYGYGQRGHRLDNEMKEILARANQGFRKVS